MSIKTITALAITIFAASFWFTATAQAGCGGKRGFSKTYSSNASYKAKQRAKARAVARARAKAKARAKARARAVAKAKAKAKAKAVRLAKAKARAKAKALRIANAKTESSFATTQSNTALLTDGDINADNNSLQKADKVADVASTQKTVVAAAGDTNCKRFSPAIGRTVTVDCN